MVVFPLSSQPFSSFICPVPSGHLTNGLYLLAILAKVYSSVCVSYQDIAPITLGSASVIYRLPVVLCVCVVYKGDRMVGREKKKQNNRLTNCIDLV